jgi:hypothetical protein
MRGMNLIVNDDKEEGFFLSNEDDRICESIRPGSSPLLALFIDAIETLLKFDSRVI